MASFPAFIASRYFDLWNRQILTSNQMKYIQSFMVNLRDQKNLQVGIRTLDLEQIIFTTYSNQENPKNILSSYFGLIDMEEWGLLTKNNLYIQS